MKRRRSLYARPVNLLRTAVRRGAASCQVVLSSCSVTATVPTAAAGVVTAERSWLAERRRRCTLSEVWTPSRRSCGRGRPGCLDGGLAVGRAVRCVDVRPMAGRTSGVHPTGVHATGGDRVSGQTGVRCPRPRHRPSAPCWILEWGGRPAIQVCAADSRCRCGRRAAWSSLPKRDGGGGMVVRLAVRGSQEGRRPRWAAAS
jgi:hypothetical protein